MGAARRVRVRTRAEPCFAVAVISMIAPEAVQINRTMDHAQFLGTIYLRLHALENENRF